MFRDIVIGLFGPVLAALAAATSVWIREQFARRDRASRRRLALSQATDEVGFIKAWVDAYRAVDPGDDAAWASDRIKRDLDRAYTVLVKDDQPLQAQEPVRLQPRSLASRFFLVGLSSPMARIGLLVYYLLLFWAAVVSSVAAVMLFTDPGVFSIVAGVLFFLTFGAVPVWSWHKLLTWVDRKHVARERGDASPAAGPPPAGVPTWPAPTVQVWRDQAWSPATLLGRHEVGRSWVGEVRFDDGRADQWVPAEHLRVGPGPSHEPS